MAKAIAVTLLTSLLLPFAIPTGGAQDQPSNLLVNGSFELDADGDHRPDGWTLVAPDGTLAARVPGPAKDGTYFLEVVRPHGTFGPVSALSTAIAVEPGATYRLAGSALGNGAAHVTLSFAGSGGNDVSVRAPNSPNGWRDFSFDFTVPYGLTEVRVGILDAGISAVGLDNLTFVRVASDNVLPAASFESGSLNNRPDLWTISCADGSWTWYGVGSHGTKSLLFSPQPFAACSRATSSFAVVEGGQAYTLSADHQIFKGTGTLGFEVCEAADAACADPLTSVSQSVSAPTGKWSRANVTVCVPEGAVKARAWVTSPGSAAQSIQWDNMTLTPAGPCP